MKKTLISQCVLLALASFGTQAAVKPAGSATACQNGSTSQTCGLTKYTDNNYYQGSGVTNAVMADATSTNIYMDGARKSGDTQSLTVSGTNMNGHYIQGSNGGTANITVNNGASVDMIEVGSAAHKTNTTVTVDNATLNGENDSVYYNTPGKTTGDKAYMMGSAIYLDPLDNGDHAVNITNGSKLHGSILSAGEGKQTISMSNSSMDKGGIYVGSLKADTQISLTNSTVDASQSEISQNIDTLAAKLKAKYPDKNINLDAFDDVAVGVYGTTNTGLTMNDSIVTGDIGLINEKGTTNLSLTNRSIVNGDVTLQGNSSNTLLVDNSTVTGDIDASKNSGNTTITLNNNATVNGDVKTGAGNDTLVLTNNSHVDGNVDGGSGSDTLSMDAGSSITGQISQFETVNRACVLDFKGS